jgi:hypothetical protein
LPAKQRKFEQGHSIKNLSDGAFSYSITNDIKRRDLAPSINQHELSSARHYQHYILLPAIQLSNHYGSHIDPYLIIIIIVNLQTKAIICLNPTTYATYIYLLQILHQLLLINRQPM